MFPNLIQTTRVGNIGLVFRSRARELKGEEISKIIAKVNNHVLELQKNVESIENIETIADGLRTTCKNKLDELINFSNALKRTLNSKITDIFEDMKKVEV